MTIYTLSINDYLARNPRWFSLEDVVTIADTADNFSTFLTATLVDEMRSNRVDFFHSTEGALVLDVAKFRAMGGVISVLLGDDVRLVDTAPGINDLTYFEFQDLAGSFDIIDATSNDAEVRISGGQAQFLLSGQMTMAADDNVRLQATTDELANILNDTAKLRTLIDKNVDIFGLNGFASVDMSLASALILAGAVSASLDSTLVATVGALDFSTLSADAIRQFGLKNIDYLSSGSSQLVLRADQAAALAETVSLSCVPTWERPSNDVQVIVKDTSANLATLSGQHIAALDAKNVDFLESTDANGALALTAAQFSALLTTQKLAVKPATVATLSDTGTAIGTALAAVADLTSDQWQRMFSKGIDAIDATDEGSIELSVGTLRSISWAFTANDTVVLKDTSEALNGLAVSDFEGLAGRGIDILDSTTGSFALSQQIFNLLGSVGFAADDTVTVNQFSGNDVANFSTQAIAELDARGVDVVDVAGSNNHFGLSAEQVAAFARTVSFGLAADEIVVLADNGSAITATFNALTVAQIGTLAAKGIDVIDAVGFDEPEAFSLSVAKFGALGSVALQASDVVTLIDTGAAFAGLSAAQIAGLSGRGIDAFDASNNRVALSLAQFNALGTLRLALEDIFDVRGTSNADTMLGKANKETILGLAGNDRLNGGAGNDTLSGGSGKDILTGGSGYDRFRFDAALNARTNLDTVTDWRNGYDRFLLDDAVFKKMGTGTATGRALSSKFFAFGARKDKDDYLSYDPKTGKVSYDADGIGTKYKAIDFLQLQKGLSAKALNAGDFLIV